MGNLETLLGQTQPGGRVLHLFQSGHTIGVQVFGSGEVAFGFGNCLRSLLHLGIDFGEIQGGQQLSFADMGTFFHQNSGNDTSSFEGRPRFIGSRNDPGYLHWNRNHFATDAHYSDRNGRVWCRLGLFRGFFFFTAGCKHQEDKPKDKMVHFHD